MHGTGHRGITDHDRTIEDALADAHIPSLMIALVHLTGNIDHLRPEWRPAYSLGGDGQGNLSADIQQAVRARALDAIRAYRDRGGSLPAPPSAATIRAMMDFIAGMDIPEHYVAFLQEELALDTVRPRLATRRIAVPEGARSKFRVLIIGAGMSGILAGIELQQAGIPFLIIEKNSDVGGTWLENLYPGCRVDNPNHLYSYSFEPNHDWPQHFSTRDVLYAYFKRTADRYRLDPHIRFNTLATAATWDDDGACWLVRLRNPDGSEETLAASVLISAVGQLNQPRYPDIEGIERFRGAAFHSARWDPTCDLDGKRVAVIGTGASAFQIVPEIAPKAEALFVFQRTPPWLAPTPNYHHDVTVGKKWLLEHLPYYAKWYRFWLFWMLTDGIYWTVQADPGWTGPANAISPGNDRLRQLLTGYIAAQVGDDPGLLEQVIPTYPVAGKRIVRDNGVWIAALKRSNVELVTQPIRELTSGAIVTGNGREFPVDVVIYGTGFHASRFLWPMTIKGKDGIDLHEHWDGDPRAYLGMTIPGFPNLFCLYGPNTNIVVNGSIIFFSECSIRYILGAIELLLENGHARMECRREVHDAFNQKVDEANARMAWGVPQVNSWYKNAKGRVTQNWPFPLVDYWTMTRAPNPDEFIFG